MTNFPDIDTIHDLLDEIAEEVPAEFFKGLNLGIILLPQEKLHVESVPDHPLLVLGEYQRNCGGSAIAIYYGSFARVYRNSSLSELREHLRYTLMHEFQHHLEYRAGLRDLELDDEAELKDYFEKYVD